MYHQEEIILICDDHWGMLMHPLLGAWVCTQIVTHWYALQLWFGGDAVRNVCSVSSLANVSSTVEISRISSDPAHFSVLDLFWSNEDSREWKYDLSVQLLTNVIICIDGQPGYQHLWLWTIGTSRLGRFSCLINCHLDHIFRAQTSSRPVNSTFVNHRSVVPL